jgi:hypothetical protein
MGEIAIDHAWKKLWTLLFDLSGLPQQTHQIHVVTELAQSVHDPSHSTAFPDLDREQEGHQKKRKRWGQWRRQKQKSNVP